MDEQERVSSVSSVSEPTLGVSVNRGNETLVENLTCEGQADEPYNEGDDGELMVEVVGSEVYVGGICGDGDGDELGYEGPGREPDTLDEHSDFRSRDAEDSPHLAGQEDDGSTGNGVKGLDVAGSSRDVSKTIGPEIVPGSLSETAPTVQELVSIRVGEAESVEGSAAPADLTSQRVGFSDGVVCNPGIESLVGSSSVVPEDGSNVEVEQASNLRLAEKDESSLREEVGEACDKYISSHARDEITDHPAEDAVSGDSGVVEKPLSEVEAMETDFHDHDTVGLVNNDDKAVAMEADLYDQDGGLLNQDNNSNSKSESAGDCADVSVSLRPDCLVHEGDDSLGVNGNDVTSHPGNQELGLTENLVAENLAIGSSSEKANHDENQVDTEPESSHPETQIGNHKEVSVEASDDSSKKVPASDKELILSSSDYLHDMKPKAADGVSEGNDLLLSSEQVTAHDTGNVEKMEIGEVCHESSGSLTCPTGDESLNVVQVGSRLENNVRIGPLETSEPVEGSEGSSFKVPVSSDKELILSCSDELQDVKPKAVDGVSEVNDFLLSSEQVNAHDTGNIAEMEIEEVRHEASGTLTCPMADGSLNVVEIDPRFENNARIGPLETSDELVEGSEDSSFKIPVSIETELILSSSDELQDVKPKAADGVCEHFLLSSEQVTAHDTGNIAEMESEVVHHEASGTVTCPTSDESLNVVEVDARLENNARSGPLETSDEPTRGADEGSGEMEMHRDGDGDVQLETTTTSLGCIIDENNLKAERRDSLETMAGAGEMRDDTSRLTDFLPEGLGADVSLQNNENGSLLGKESDPKMSALSPNDDIMSETPEGSSLACQNTAKYSDFDVLDDNSPLLLKDKDLQVEAECLIEARDTAVGQCPTQDHNLIQDTENCVFMGMNSNITAKSESTANQEVIVENTQILALEVDHNPVNTKTADKILNEGNNSNVEAAVEVPLPVRDQTVETRVSYTSDEEMNQAALVVQVHTPEMNVTDEQEKSEAEKLYPGTVQECAEQEEAADEIATMTDQPVMLSEKPVSLSKVSPGYLLPPESEGEYSVSDLVWGKVRSHPWWPGQIFDPSDASEKAVKYHKKDSFLVAYFGDRTFAWNDASLLKPFWSNFSHIERHGNSEAFQNALTCALDEVSRRFELGLACSCIPEDSYDNISCQIVENTGISEESSKRYGVDRSTGVTSFGPDRLMNYMRALALSPTSGADRLDLTIAQAQLVAFCRFKGYRLPTKFLSSGELLENDAEVPLASSASDEKSRASEDGEQYPSSKVSAHKRKHSSKDNLQPRKKEQHVSELMDDMECEYFPDGEDDSDGKTMTSSKKRKAVNSLADGPDKRTSVYAAKVSKTAFVSPKPSFRIGECIQRVASQLTGSASLLKCNSDQTAADVQYQDSPKGKAAIPSELTSPKELLSQLQSVAWAPMKGYSFLKTIISFFSGFRNSVAVSQHRRQNLSAGRPGGGRKRKASQTVAGSAEDFEFDDINDSYWTDRIVQNYGEEQLLPNGESREGENHLTIYDPEKPIKPSRRSYNRKRKPSADYDLTPDVPSIDIEKRKREPAELILNFVEGDPLPSEMNLNKMFKRFGPLKELETEVYQESSRARVVFKRGSDAEVAHSSVEKFNIFGSRRVNYELSYTPVISFKPILITLTPDQGEAI